MLPTLAPLEREKILRLALAANFKRKQAPPLRITPTERASQMPLSFAQQRLWFLEQLEPGKANYNVPVVLRLTGNLEVPFLEQALSGVVERHEILRTRFVLCEDEETPFQQIDPPEPVRLRQTELTGNSYDVDAAAESWIQQQAQQPFDLTQGPLLRAGLLRIDAARSWLCLVMHHSVVDGWSVGLLLREAGELYTALCRRRPMVLPTLPLQYADFALWQRHWLTGAVYEQQRQYWTRQLRALQPLELPSDFPRPPLPTFRGATEHFTVPPALKQKLLQLSQSEGATLFMTLLAAFQVLLARYSGQDDIAVGTPVANRNRVETEDLIGFFINTLVLRTQVTPTLSFRELLAQVRTVCLQAYAHQDMPFERLVQELNPERDLSRSPLFQVMFVLQNGEGTEWEPLWNSGGLEAILDFAETGSAKFDLHLTMGEAGDEIAASLDYSLDLFTAARMQSLLRHFAVLLERVTASPDQPLSEFSLLTREEEQQRRLWNQTAHLGRGAETLVSLFEQQVKRTPRTIALISGGSRLNYLDLNHRANQVAHHLVQLGVTPETFVGIHLERSIDAVVTMLAVLKAGATYLPLDPEYPRDRLEHMIQESSLNYIVTRADLQPELLSMGPKHICLDKEWLQISRCNTANPNRAISPGQAAYLIFTSGSTGRPKGLLGTHRATLNRLSWMHTHYPYAAGDVCCARASLNFVDSVSELFGPLLKGVTTVLLSSKLVLDMPRLVQTLAAHGVTRLLIVPSLLQILLEAHDSGQITLPRLKYWISSGESLTSSVANPLFAFDPATRLLNLYGSSEVAGDVTWHEMSQAETGPFVPIGRPVSNTQVHLLDRHLQPVPVGIEGEIFVDGTNLARGYLNHSALTAERFWPNPFTAEPGSRMYRTGDYGRYLANGDIVVHGRKDFQVKVRGHRVELSEIEAALLAHPNVRQATVVPRITADGHANLVAYFVAVEESKSVISELRLHLKATLPPYMLPVSITELPALPMTSNMKVNRRALSELAASPDESFLEEELSTDLERTIRDVWKNLLTLDRVGLDDNFFDVGGHSLQLVRLRNRLRHATKQDLSILDLFTHTTIRSLTRLLTERGAELVLQPA